MTDSSLDRFPSLEGHPIPTAEGAHSQDGAGLGLLLLPPLSHEPPKEKRWLFPHAGDPG